MICLYYIKQEFTKKNLKPLIFWFSTNTFESKDPFIFGCRGPWAEISDKIITTSNIVYFILSRGYLPLSASVKSNFKQDIKFV